ncbi:hypothetical protein HF313_14900 [Massilia atriviolacea]|uniref:Uncharacterized protein n=1 Tax=Massilia atriviolacea TaxID=2495579 RepID=A0A430HR45_9BURK|nr:hypothetical protein [Massilia atriviolacea]RSZ60001.1 hypothetical protein EJB06_07425 [Massilia atriviolacea]
MSKGSARRPGHIPDDAWERIFHAPIEPPKPEAHELGDESDGAEVPRKIIDLDDGEEKGGLI